MRWDWQAIGTIVAIAAVAVTLIFNLLSQRLTRAGQRLIERGRQQGPGNGRGHRLAIRGGIATGHSVGLGGINARNLTFDDDHRQSAG